MAVNDRDMLHLENIIEYCDTISQAIDELGIDYDAFSGSRVRRGALAFFVSQIGEEANKLSRRFRDEHPEMDWEAIVNFRHHIVHSYVGVVPDVLWDTVQNDIPELRSFCEEYTSVNKRIDE